MRTRRTGETRFSSRGKETEVEEEDDASAQRCLSQTRREGEAQQRGGEKKFINRYIAGREDRERGDGEGEEKKQMMEGRRTSRDTDPWLLRLT